MRTSIKAREELKRVATINGISYAHQRKIVLSKIKCGQTTCFFIKNNLLDVLFRDGVPSKPVQPQKRSLHPLVTHYIEKLVKAIKAKHPDHHCDVERRIVEVVHTYVNDPEERIPFG
jgi:hypothetical protein